ncbi:MAG: anion permease [Candidatus Hatepunaea meridiana]|nr:anion permease [Candidatus Hatepunaea meridiana]
MEAINFPYYLLVSAVVISFYAAFMGGANDFANAFGTSVGSNAITFKQAILIAIIAELIGAVMVGGNVTDTVRKGIVDPSNFETDPMLLVYGLLAALIGSGVFLQAATHFGVPVSTTHAIVGAMVGFGIVACGFESICWGKVARIAMSWVVSPIGGGIAAYATFRVIQNRILERRNPVAAASKMVPVFVGLTGGILALSMLYKGLKNLHLDLPLSQAVIAALVIGLLAMLIARSMLPRSSDRSRRVQLAIVEGNFKYLQIITAGYVAFAHGANDVANAVGPLAGIWTIYHKGLIGLKAEVPIWILVMGGTGIVLGLAVFGKKVIETVGKKITSITPSRGFAAEFSAATIVLVFSKLGMPVSTTHTLVGAVIGVGLARGIGAIDMRVVKRILMSWVITIPAAAIATAIVYLILIEIFI